VIHIRTETVIDDDPEQTIWWRCHAHYAKRRGNQHSVGHVEIAQNAIASGRWMRTHEGAQRTLAQAIAELDAVQMHALLGIDRLVNHDTVAEAGLPSR
jgi:hypothetical protein